MQTVRAKVKKKDNEGVDRLIERFSSVVRKRDIIYQYEENRYYTPNSEERRKAQYAAKMRENERQRI